MNVKAQTIIQSANENRGWAKVPAEVRRSQFGCASCLWNSCECSGGKMYKPGDGEE